MFSKNLAANIYSQGVNLALQLVTVPLFLHFWGVESYGEWLILAAVPTYLTLSEMGFSTVAANSIALSAAKKDAPKVRVTIDSLCGFMLGLCLVLVGLIWMVAQWLPWVRILGLDHSGKDVSIWVIRWLGCYTVLTMFGGSLEAPYRAEGRFARGVFLANSFKACEIVVTAIVLVSGGGPVQVALSWAVARIAGNLVMWCDLRFNFPSIAPGLASFSIQEVRQLLRPSFAYLAFPIGNALYFQGTTFVVNAVLGPAAVVTFNSSRTLSRLITRGVTALKHSAWPEFSRLVGSGQMAGARQLNRVIFAASLWGSISGGVILLVAGDTAMQVWTGDRVQVGFLMWALLVAGVVVNGLWFSCSSVLMGTNQHEGMAIRFVASSAAAIGISYIACGIMGVRGGAVSMLMVELFMMPYVLRESCRVLEDKWREVFRSALAPQEACRLFMRILAHKGRASP